MTTYNGFFQRENETALQYQLRQPKQEGITFVQDDPYNLTGLNSCSYGPIKATVHPDTGEVIQWDESDAHWAAVSAGSHVDEQFERIERLQAEISMVKDRLARTEAFTNSILQTLGEQIASQSSPPPMIVHEDDFKLLDISLVEHPTDTRALLPRDESDYDRAMALVGK